MIVKIIMLVLIVLLLVLDYALVVIAHEADEQAERMYNEWEETCNERSHNQTE